MRKILTKKQYNPFDREMANSFKEGKKFRIQLEEQTEFIENLISEKRVIRLGNRWDNDYVILHPSTKKGKYQLTYFKNSEPFSDEQFDSLDEVVDKLRKTQGLLTN